MAVVLLAKSVLSDATAVALLAKSVLSTSMPWEGNGNAHMMACMAVTRVAAIANAIAIAITIAIAAVEHETRSALAATDKQQQQQHPTAPLNQVRQVRVWSVSTTRAKDKFPRK